MNDYVKVFTEIPLIIRRLKFLLEEKNIISIIKSDKIIGYEISNNRDDLFILNTDLEKAQPIIDTYKKEIAK